MKHVLNNNKVTKKRPFEDNNENDVPSDEETTTTICVPYESRNVHVCLPCIGTDFYEEKDAFEQMHARIKAYRSELGAQGLVRREFFDLLKKVSIPNPKKWATNGTSFLCAHNVCGYFSPDDCSDFSNCCHHNFRLNLDTQIPTHALLHCYFFKNLNGGVKERQPMIKMKWHQHVSIKGVGDMTYTN